MRLCVILGSKVRLRSWIIFTLMSGGLHTEKVSFETNLTFIVIIINDTDRHF